MTDPTDALLTARGKTHGDFAEHAEVTQAIKDIVRSHAGWARLTRSQRESLDMLAHKVGRVIAGDPNFADHWDDIAGYARLVSKQLAAPLEKRIDPHDLLKHEAVQAFLKAAKFTEAAE